MNNILIIFYNKKGLRDLKISKVPININNKDFSIFFYRDSEEVNVKDVISEKKYKNIFVVLHHSKHDESKLEEINDEIEKYCINKMVIRQRHTHDSIYNTLLRKVVENPDIITWKDVEKTGLFITQKDIDINQKMNFLQILLGGQADKAKKLGEQYGVEISEEDAEILKKDYSKISSDDIKKKDKIIEEIRKKLFNDVI